MPAPVVRSIEFRGAAQASRAYRIGEAAIAHTEISASVPNCIKTKEAFPASLRQGGCHGSTEIRANGGLRRRVETEIAVNSH